jgi:hypothetical protein
VEIERDLDIVLPRNVPVEFALRYAYLAIPLCPNIHLVGHTSAWEDHPHPGVETLVVEQSGDEMLEGVTRGTQFQNGPFELVFSGYGPGLLAQAPECTLVNLSRAPSRLNLRLDLGHDVLDELGFGSCTLEGTAEFGLFIRRSFSVGFGDEDHFSAT